MMAAGLAALTLSGCASNDPAPLEQMRLTEQALEQAKAVGATDDVAELKLAQDKYAAAQIAMTAESYKKRACWPSRPSWTHASPSPRC